MRRIVTNETGVIRASSKRLTNRCFLKRVSMSTTSRCGWDRGEPPVFSSIRLVAFEAFVSGLDTLILQHAGCRLAAGPPRKFLKSRKKGINKRTRQLPMAPIHADSSDSRLSRRWTPIHADEGGSCVPREIRDSEQGVSGSFTV